MLFGLGKLIATMYGALVIFVVLVLGSIALVAQYPAAPFLPPRWRSRF